MAKSILIHPHTEPSLQPTLPGIDCVPPKARGHGLREAHSRPCAARAEVPPPPTRGDRPDWEAGLLPNQGQRRCPGRWNT